jgi:hypothetical protein
MTFGIQVEIAQLENALRALASGTGKELRRALREDLGRPLVADLIKFTPPNIFKGARQQSHTEQRKIGQSRVRMDLRRLFIGKAQLDALRAAKGTLGASIARAVKVGDINLANQLLTRGHWRETAAYEPTRALHRAARDARGRVAKNAKGIFVHNEAARREFLADRLRFVGLGKSGWNTAADGVGLAARHRPAYVRALGGDGVYTEEGTAAAPVMTLGNNVPHIQAAGRELRIIDAALKVRRQLLPKQLEQTLRAIARRARVKAT